MYPEYLLITYGWYGQEWWTGKATSPNFNCTVEQRSQALAYSLAPRVQESYTNLTAQDVSGMVRMRTLCNKIWFTLVCADPCLIYALLRICIDRSRIH